MVSTTNNTVTTVNRSGLKHRVTKGIWIENQTVLYFPAKLENVFPNLEIIHVTNSSLKAIEKNDLKPFPNLKKLILNNNDLVNLEADLFRYSTKLQVIDFSNNKLSYAGPELLRPLRNLKTASFASNACIDKAITNETEILSLTTDLANNCTKRIVNRPGKATHVRT